MTDTTSAALNQVLQQEGLALAPEQVEQLDRYRELLWDWNSRMNLTRHTTLEKFVGRDVVDSLQLAELIGQGRRVVDIGSGGGVPGIMLAICRPDLHIALCESTQKKARALQAMVESLGLKTEVFGCRLEELLAFRTFHVGVARAVASMAKILGWLQPHRDALDELLLIKGRSWVEERKEARHRGLLHDWELRKAAVYAMPLPSDERERERVEPASEAPGETPGETSTAVPNARGESVILRLTASHAEELGA